MNLYVELRFRHGPAARMSYQARKLVEYAKTKGAPRFVLRVIADCSREKKAPFLAYPGFDLIARETGFSKSTVSKHIDTILENGDMRVMMKGNGRGKATVYEITVRPSEQINGELNCSIPEGETVRFGAETVRFDPLNCSPGRTQQSIQQYKQQTDSQSDLSDEEWINSLDPECRRKGYTADELYSEYLKVAGRKGWRISRMGFAGFLKKQHTKPKNKPSSSSNGSDPEGWKEFLKSIGRNWVAYKYAPDYLKTDFKSGKGAGN